MEDDARIAPADLLVKSKLKKIAAENEFRMSEEVFKELGHVVTRHLKRAMARAKANGRKTVKAQDV